MTDYLQQAIELHTNADDWLEEMPDWSADATQRGQHAALISIAQSLQSLATAAQPAPVAEKRPVVFRWSRGRIRFDTVHRVNVRGDNDITVIIDDSFIQIHDADAARFLVAYDEWLEPQAEQAAPIGPLDVLLKTAAL